MRSLPEPKHMPPEERFGELFKASRALFEAGVADEDVVYPTLVFANEIGQRLDFATAKERLVAARNDAKAWREQTASFARKYRSFTPARVVEGALFLKLRPASAVVRNYRTTDVPEEVEIRVPLRKVPASSEQVEAAYEEALSDTGIPCDVSHRISLYSEFGEGLLWMLVKNGEEVPEAAAPIVWQERKPRFPHPRLIGALYDALLGKHTQGQDGFERHVKIRQRSRPPEMYNLIPACAAFFLRTYGGLTWREVFSLLNDNMLGAYHPQGVVPEEKDDPQSHHSRTSQLEGDVKKVEKRLHSIAHVLHYPGG